MTEPSGVVGPEDRVMNFAAGPSALPVSVLQKLQTQLLNYNGSGVGILEIGHRSSDFTKIIQEAENDLRTLLYALIDDAEANPRSFKNQAFKQSCFPLKIPDNYSVLFMQGGGTGQFAAVPLNLLKDSSEKADYLVTGAWSKKAVQEAQKFGQVSVVFDGASTGYTTIPSERSYNADAKYYYFCANETIHGVEFGEVPVKVKEEEGGPVLVADMSSNFLSRPVTVSDYGVIVAGAQKNAGIAGLVIVIVRKDLLNRATPSSVPAALSYHGTDTGKSVVNTPPTFAIYVSGLMFKWLLEQGGVEAIEQKSIEKSKLLYDYVDSTNGFYVNKVQHEYRSRMNVPLRITEKGNAELEALFVKEASKRGFKSLNGHASVGGLRISLYNAIPLSFVESLIEFMKLFHQQHKNTL